MLPIKAEMHRQFLMENPNWIFEKLDRTHYLFVRKDVSKLLFPPASMFNLAKTLIQTGVLL